MVLTIDTVRKTIEVKNKTSVKEFSDLLLKLGTVFEDLEEWEIIPYKDTLIHNDWLQKYLKDDGLKVAPIPPPVWLYDPKSQPKYDFEVIC
jgi:hypothetical protein